jgi:hypothetical protein
LVEVGWAEPGVAAELEEGGDPGDGSGVDARNRELAVWEDGRVAVVADVVCTAPGDADGAAVAVAVGEMEGESGGLKAADVVVGRADAEAADRGEGLDRRSDRRRGLGVHIP